MGRVTCKAVKNGEVKRRGKPSIEFFIGNKPQYYCYGYIDAMTDEVLDTCRRCPDFVDKAQRDSEKAKGYGNCVTSVVIDETGGRR